VRGLVHCGESIPAGPNTGVENIPAMASDTRALLTQAACVLGDFGDGLGVVRQRGGVPGGEAAVSGGDASVFVRRLGV
jgi:hypothetical protein